MSARNGQRARFQIYRRRKLALRRRIRAFRASLRARVSAPKRGHDAEPAS